MEGKQNNTQENKEETDNEQQGKKWLYISLALATLFVVLFFVTFFVVRAYFTYVNKPGIEKNTNIEQNADGVASGDYVRRKIDGVYVEKGKEDLYPIAVIIDNHPDAYPQAGLASANLVFEVEVEGGISRYMAIYSDSEGSEEIGPIRSARPYFLDWVQEFSACFTHCGGSPEALVRISRDNILDMNEFYKGEYFWRDEDRPMPHNVMTSNSNLREYLSVKEKEEASYFGWKFKDPQILDTEAEHDSEINVSNFGVKWVFDPEANEYTRYLHGEVHEESDGTDIKARNIAVAYVEAKVIDEILRLEMQTIGTSSALICFDGNCREGEWHKKSSSARMRFYTIKGEEFIFNSGTTWVEVIRPEYKVEY